MAKEPKKTKKQLEEELLNVRGHCRVFANALAFLLPENQGIVVEVSEETKQRFPELSIISVINFGTQIKIDLVKDQDKRKPGDRLIVYHPDQNPN